MPLELSEIKRQIQDHLQEGLLLVVGTGLSMAEDVPGMGPLAEHLKTEMPPKLSKAPDPAWSQVGAALDVFYRTGLIERWGRGTNRVAVMCREAGIPIPEFSAQGPSAVVTFRVNVAGIVLAGEPIIAQVTAQVTAQVVDFCQTPRS